MNVSDEMLMALADGELTGPDASKLMARIRANPDLAARYGTFTATAQALREAMDPGPVPDHLISAVLTAPTGAPSDTAQVLPMRPRPPAGSRMIWPMALAASLVLAAGIGGYLTGSASGPLPTGPDTAARALAQMATGNSVALPDGGSARVLGTVQTDLGLCRLIALEQATGRAERAVVCKGVGDGWQTALSVTEGGEGMFLPASDMAVGMIDDFLDRIGAGPLLEPEDEARALNR